MTLTASVFRPLRRSPLHGSAALVLAAAVVSGCVVERTPLPSPPAAGLPAAATNVGAVPSVLPTASPSTAATKVLDDRFGFLLVGDDRQRLVVRSEGSDAELASFFRRDRSFVSASQAVSPDGRAVAYWDVGAGAPVLKVHIAAGGAARTVLTGPPEMEGSAFAWSSDSTGVVVALDNGCFEFCRGPSLAELWTVDVATGASERIASGRFWVPVAWDRAAGLVTAGVTGPGGYVAAYDVISLGSKPYSIRSTAFPQPLCCALGLRGSRDARYVLLSWVGADLEWWPVADPGRRTTIPSGALRAVWRPGTNEIWWVGGLTPAGCRGTPCVGTELIAYDVASGQRSVVARGTFGATLVGFRVDGTAAITEATGVPRELLIVEILSGRTVSVVISGQFSEAVRLR